MIKEKVNEIHDQAVNAFSQAQSSQELYDLKVKFLGKQGEFSQVMREMAKLSKEERPAFGKLVNEKKNLLENVYHEREEQLKHSELEDKISKEYLDLTLPGTYRAQGSRHPIASVTTEIVNILSRLGYSVRTGPLVELDRYNFEALNFPPDHPSRDMQDTFYIDGEHVLRTHTSPVQVRTMELEKPPLRILSPGSVFRCDSDLTHSPNFHQIEGLFVDRKASMADLKGTVAFFVREFFETDLKTRFRPSFFPFTEPSAEVDCQCPICKGKGCRVCSHTGWVEIGGCGLVNPKVFEHSGLDPKEWQGFAWGFGVERMAMIKYGIGDIRLFSDNDIRFLQQFS